LKEGAVDSSRERDQSVERLLRQLLQAPRNAGVTDSCLDAETAAAWVDGGLSGGALETARSHVAGCARCEALVGALGRIDSAASQIKPERAPRRWLAWLVPLAAAAAVVALWVAVPRDTGDKSDQAGSGTRVSKPTEIQQQAADATTRTAADKRQPLTPGAPLQAEAAKRDAAAPSQPAQVPELRNDAVARREAAPLAAPALSAAPAAPSPAAPAAPSSAAPAEPSAAPAGPAPAAPSLSLKMSSARSAARVAESAPIVIVSPDPSVRWRVAGTVVERSTNGGTRWEAVPTGIAADLTAGVAPSASVCWLVGRGGVVLLSTDGRTWRRVTFPESTDLSAIRATDARTATVSSSDGRLFGTIDGGVTWTSRPPQEF
jgi:hypothetical protein